MTLFDSSRLADGRLRELAQLVQVVVFDFDGVFTDNAVYVASDGTEMVRCSRADGLGLRKLEALGKSPMILSTEVNPVVGVRARKLKIPCTQGCDDKLAALRTIAAERGVGLEAFAFVGNDVNDAECLANVGLPIVVADAHPDVLELGLYRTRTLGGHGAVREVCDLLHALLERSS